MSIALVVIGAILALCDSRKWAIPGGVVLMLAGAALWAFQHGLIRW